MSFLISDGFDSRAYHASFVPRIRPLYLLVDGMRTNCLAGSTDEAAWGNLVSFMTGSNQLSCFLFPAALPSLMKLRDTPRVWTFTQVPASSLRVSKACKDLTKSKNWRFLFAAVALP